jgi:glycosyltransferase involved in cell wall biosynthesis
MQRPLPVLSVITPVLNGERFIEACIRSAAAQNYPRMEHIVVDGLSSDRTCAIVQELLREYPHLRLLSERDQGQSDALNKGIRAARGDYIGILNVDDFYAPSTLLRVGDLIASLPGPRLLVANCNILGDDDRLLSVNKPSILKIEKLLARRDLYPPPVNPSAYFYPRGLHDEIGYYDINDHYGMDLQFVLSAVQHIKALYVDEIWGNFRRIEGTKTFEDQKRGTDKPRIRKIYRDTFSKLPLRGKIRVASTWMLFKILRRFGMLGRSRAIAGSGMTVAELPPSLSMRDDKAPTGG